MVAAAPGHVGAVRHLVLDPLDANQITALGRMGEQLLAQLRAHLRGHGDDPTTDC